MRARRRSRAWSPRAREIAQRVPPDNGFVSLPKPARDRAGSAQLLRCDRRCDARRPGREAAAGLRAHEGLAALVVRLHDDANQHGRGRELARRAGGVHRHDERLAAQGDRAEQTSGFAEFYSPDYAGSIRRPCAERAATKATVSRVPASFAPGNYTVLLEPSAFAAALKALTEGMGADNVLEDKDSWMVGRIGKRLFSPNFTLRDDWSHPLFANPPFNVNDGAPTKKLTLIDRGVVEALRLEHLQREQVSRCRTPATRIFPPTASSSRERNRARR